MNLQQTLSKTITKQVLQTPRGRAWFLSQIAEAEDNGEAALFDEAAEIVDDPRFAKMIRRHQEDEIRHGQRFRAALRKQGVDLGPVPEDVQVLKHIDDALGGFLSRPLTTIDDVRRAYLVLQAVEERAVAQFGLYGPLFQSIDPEIAEIFREVTADEVRHLRYCKAITRHYARSEAELAEELAEMRRVEAAAFRKMEMANTAHIQRLGLIENPLVRLVLGGLSRLDRLARPRPAALSGAPVTLFSKTGVEMPLG